MHQRPKEHWTVVPLTHRVLGITLAVVCCSNLSRVEVWVRLSDWLCGLCRSSCWCRGFGIARWLCGFAIWMECFVCAVWVMEWLAFIYWGCKWSCVGLNEVYLETDMYGTGFIGVEGDDNSVWQAAVLKEIVFGRFVAVTMPSPACLVLIVLSKVIVQHLAGLEPVQLD